MSITATDTPLMSPAEAAAFLNVNRDTLDKLRRVAGLPSFKVGAQVRIDRGELIAWLERERVLISPRVGPDAGQEAAA